MTSDIALINIKYPKPYKQEDTFMPDEQENKNIDWNDVMSNWLSTDQVAEMTGLKPTTVRLYCKQGKFDAVLITRVWKINPNDPEITNFRKDRRGRQRKE